MPHVGAWGETQRLFCTEIVICLRLSDYSGGLSDAELSTLVKAAVLGKRAALGGHGDMYGIAGAKNRPMTTIGG